MPALPRTRRRVATAALGAIMVALSPLAPTVADAAPSTSLPTFSHEVVTDMQRSGFEPGIQVDSKDNLYTSVPYGFSDTMSFLWSSRDHGSSYQLVPGSVAAGKTATCAGGGDSELALDAKDNLYFSDLQGLTNLSNSVTSDGGKTFTASCTSAPNTPVDRMWYAVHGSLGDPDFAIYETYDQVNTGLDPNSNNTPTNQLVETVSHDGVNFLPVVNADPTQSDCLGGGVQDCVTDDEGIPGNQVLSADGKTLYIAHTDGSGNKVVVSIGTLTTDATTGTVTAAWKHVVVNSDICPTGGNGEPCGAALFATIAQDTQGGLYVVAASAPHTGSTQSGPYAVYLWHSTDHGQSWSAASSASNDGSNAFPWITAGDPGRVDITYYHATETSEGGKYAFDNLVHGSFTVEMSQSLDALSAAPSFTRTTVSEHPVKYGPICTSGLNCTVTGGDRSLGDYLQVGHDSRGAAVVAFVDDTSNAYSTGAGPTGQVANTGPSVVSRQVGGPSLFTAVGTVPGAGAGPSTPYATTTDPTGDADYSANSQRTAAGDNLDLTGATLSDDGTTLTAVMSLKSLASLQVNPAAGGTTGEWITRFTTYNAGATPGNGHIYYLGMESVAGQAPTFFAGDTKRTRLFMTYQQEIPATGSVDTTAGTVTVKVPLAALAGAGGADALTAGSTLYSATAFTATTAATLKSDPEGLFNLTDATTPVDYTLGQAAPTPVVPEVPYPALVALLGAALIGVSLRRRQVRG